MCIVCVMWEKGKLTPKEVDRALAELVVEGADIIHIQEVLIKVDKAGNGP